MVKLVRAFFVKEAPFLLFMKKIIIILVLIIIAAVGYYYIKFTDFYTHIYSESKNLLLKKPPEEQHIFNILLMGYGGRTFKPISTR